MNSPKGEAKIASFLIETDILLALISPEDKHHAEVITLLDKFAGEIQLSPYSLIELDLLLKSREVIIAETKTFYALIDKVLKYRQIGLSSIKPAYHGEAWELREKYKELTYFDSLHAAVGVMENLELLSYDKEYAKIERLTYTHPNKYT
nr:PIN domain-containing protein [Candidatus Freyarchaeota archaeon]